MGEKYSGTRCLDDYQFVSYFLRSPVYTNRGMPVMGYITAEIVVDAFYFRHHFGAYGMTHAVASGAPTEQRFPD